MKQVLLGKGITVSEVPSPPLGSRQILVETAYSFISTGTEIAGVQGSSDGLLKKALERPKRIAQTLEMIRINGLRRTFARIDAKMQETRPLGYSCSGRVIGLGRDVTGFSIGDLVACAGGGYANHAEVVAVPVNLVAKLPPGCDLRSASGATIASIALQGIRRADLRLGETAAVVGLGLLGQITMQLLAANGVKAIGFDPDPQRVQETQSLGFESCLPFTGPEAAAAAMERTNQLGVDATIITAASSAPGICQSAIEMTRRRGKVVVVGAVPLTFDRSPFYAREIDFLISCSYGPGRYDTSYEEGGQDYPYAYVRWTENRNMQAVLELIARGSLRLDPLIAAEFPVEKADEAFAALSNPAGPRPLGVVLKYEWTGDTVAPQKMEKSQTLAGIETLPGRIGVGVIGVGSFFTNIHLPSLAVLKDRYAVTAVCDVNGARAKDVAAQFGASLVCTDAAELLARSDVQLVIVSTRHDTHAPLAMQALRAGKNVFVEKPMAMDDAQLQELLPAIQEAQRFYMVGFNRRFSPHVVRLKKLLETRSSPLVGTYRVFSGRAPRDSWIYSPAGGGRVIGEACHMLDLMNHLVGESVALEEIDVIAPPSGTGGMPGDNFVASLRYQDGSLFTLTYSTLGRASKNNGKERIETLWDGKTYVIEDFVHSFGAGCSAGSAGKSMSKGHFEELQAMADHLAGKGPVPISIDACIQATRQSFLVNDVCRSRTNTEENARP
jgi:predicted dehydrogenase/threonine dehydrogenase-like Zn-dependent dehydrogenase